MRKGILLIFTMLATLIGCVQYDDSELKSDINDLKSRMAALEKQCKNMNENLTSLQAIVDAIQKQDGIVSVTDLPDGQGYSVKFVSGKVIYLYNGKNGTDGVTPKISVRKDSDGIYYWTVDGDWLIVDGKKVRAVGLDGKDGQNGNDGKDGKDAVTPQLKIVDGFWYISYDNGKSWSKLGKATGENGKDGQDGDVFFKSVTVEDGYAVFVMNDSEQTTLKIPIAGVSAVSSIKYVPESLDGVVKVRYSKIGGKNVPIDIVIMFEVMPQGAVDYIVKNWKDVLTAKAIYASSTKAAIGDFVTMNIKNVVGGDDNIIVVTIDAKSLDDLFFSTNIPVVANLRLAVNVNGSESISSDYLPLSPLLSYDQIIEYTTTSGRPIDYEHCFEIKRNGLAISFTDNQLDDTWQIYFEGMPGEKNLFSCMFSTVYNYNGGQSFDPSNWLKSLSFVTPIEVESLSFSGCWFTEVDVSNVNTENVKVMKEMFSNCGLTSIDLSSFDTKNVTDMSRMFSGSALTSIDLYSFDTKNVTNMCGMFEFCRSLASLNLSSFDTRNVTKMYQMFNDCESLTSLDLSSFDTNNVTSMWCMFYNCKSLASLNLSSFDTRNVKEMREMFSDCKSLTSLNLSSFDTRKVTNMENMFGGCKSLTNLDLSSFDTRNVTRMNAMFAGCESLASLNLPLLDAGNGKNMEFMFYGCSNLTNLNLSNSSINKNCYTYRMFDGCTNLKEIIMRGCDKTTIEMISKEKPEGAVIITD